MERIFDNYKGVILFYLVIMILSFLCVVRINSLNNIADANNTYYAYKK